jgi:hypothetical protein
MSGPATASPGIVETQQMDVHSSIQSQLSSSKQSSSGATILYPELSFLLRYTTSLPTLILQDFCKILKQ